MIFLMAYHAMFEGLVYDQNNHSVDVAYIGDEAHYVIDDMGFRRHVEAEPIDRQIVTLFVSQMRDHKELAVAQALQMVGRDDLFTKAAIEAQLRNVNVDDIVGQIIPPQARDYLALMGFRIVINHHGELVDIKQPTHSPFGEEDDD